jgi:hypothetical protein
VRDKWGLAVVAVVAIAIAHPICNLFFRCGCDWLGPAHCNIHSAGLHCPWCVAPWRFVAVGALWALGAWLGARKRHGLVAVFLGGMGGLACGALVSGAATVLLTGYPHFIFW